jgi:GntR family transcriptional regulator/MocR family aminotransferase
MTSALHLSLDLGSRRTLAIQIHDAIGRAVREGRLEPGARLPSWRDLAAQLGVARGTVRAAYERLMDEQFLVSAGAAGTFVADRPPIAARPADGPVRPPLPGLFYDHGVEPLPFQMGVPAQDAFPFKLWSRLLAAGARAAAAQPVSYPDPRGLPALRQEIAAYLGYARGFACSPAQVIVTAGFAGGLGLALGALGLHGRRGWIEDPGFPLSRHALTVGGIETVAVPVDAKGLDVAAGEALAPDAGLALVTPGQQAPLGLTMALERRLALLDWAERAGAWLIEDDYLSELQLRGRAAPALASLDRTGRVIHIGSFSKTISPALRLGFLVVPPTLAERFGDYAACLAPAPALEVQRAVTSFLAEGHYLRHLRRMKRLYVARADALRDALRPHEGDGVVVHPMGGLAVRVELPDGVDDGDAARRALAYGLAPVPLSGWYAMGAPRPGFLLGVTNVTPSRIALDCDRLFGLIRR